MSRNKHVTQEEYVAIKQAIESGIPTSQIVKMFDRDQSTIWRIRNGKLKMKLPAAEEEEPRTIDFVLKLDKNKYNQLCATARFYGFIANSEFIMSCINEKYLEAKTDIDMMTEKEARQRQFDEEFAKLKEKYADLFERRTEESVD